MPGPSPSPHTAQAQSAQVGRCLELAALEHNGQENMVQSVGLYHGKTEMPNFHTLVARVTSASRCPAYSRHDLHRFRAPGVLTAQNCFRTVARVDGHTAAPPCQEHHWHVPTKDRASHSGPLVQALLSVIWAPFPSSADLGPGPCWADSIGVTCLPLTPLNEKIHICSYTLGCG